MQQNDLVNEFAWGTIWARPGLSLKKRSLVTLGMLAALDRQDELTRHILGALNNGATKEKIIEVFVHSAVYCGFPISNTRVRLCASLQGRRAHLAAQSAVMGRGLEERFGISGKEAR